MITNKYHDYNRPRDTHLWWGPGRGLSWKAFPDSRELDFITSCWLRPPLLWLPGRQCWELSSTFFLFWVLYSFPFFISYVSLFNQGRRRVWNELFHLTVFSLSLLEFMGHNIKLVLLQNMSFLGEKSERHAVSKCVLWYLKSSYVYNILSLHS